MLAPSVHVAFRKIATRLVVALACALSIASTAVNAAAGVITVVEYYNAGLQHYFISADPAEIAFLDGGAFGGAWQRTGESFPALDISGAAAGTVPVCRFFGTDRYRTDGTRIGPNSHFYTSDPAECAYVKTGYQSVASDGVSYPAWTYESNAFAVNPTVGGVCPADTQSLYRTYNDGMHGDPGHRYSTRPDLLQGMVGWVYEGLVMCLPQGSTPTAVGTAAGAAASAGIGAAGGSLSSPDGQLTLTIPAGALASTTTIGIQPISNNAHGQIGLAYRLTPDGLTFPTPITLTFKYADAELAGTAATFLGVAFQTTTGYWQLFGVPTIDQSAKTVSVHSSHFTDVSKVKGLQIRPPSKTIKPKASVVLHVKVCYIDPGNNVIALGFDCDLDQGPDGILTVDEWSVNGIPGGNAALGTVIGDNTTATYTAPANAPTPPTVAVSGRAHVAQLSGSDLVVSNITIAQDSWVGTATGKNEFVTTVAQVTWTLDTMVANVAVYKPSGVASATVAPVGPCTFSFNPPNHTIDVNTVPPYNTEGSLTIDFNTTPPTYHGYAFTNWVASLDSPCGPSVPNIGGGPWFGGSANPQAREATGFVAPDGVTIQGSGSDAQNPPATYTWKFTRTQ